MRLKNFSDYEIYPEEGKVWSYKTNQFVGKPYETISGYWLVTLYDDNGKKHNFYLHRLIWEAVYGKIPENMEINHLDENPSNNVASNLSLCTHKENINWGTRTQRQAEKQRGVPKPTVAEKLTNGKRSKKVAAFKNGVLVLVFPSTMEAQRQGYNSGNVSACCNGKLPHYKGYQWRYLN